MDDLQNLKYKELQKLAKAAGIKANSPKAELVNALIAFNSESEAEDDIEKKPEEETSAPIPETLEEKLDVVVQNKMNETFEKDTSGLNVTFDKEDELNDSAQTQDQSAEEGTLGSRFVEFMEDGKDEVSFRRSSRRSLEKRTSTPVIKHQTPSQDYLNKKNKTPLRQVVKTPGSIKKKSDSNIPRFMKYATKTNLGSSVRKVPNFAKIHAKNSEKLDSLDDYVERKKKLTDTVKKQLDQARAVAEEHNSIVNKVKSKFVPAVTSTAKMNLNFGNTSASSKKKEPFKFDSKPVAAAPKVALKERKDPKTSRTAKAKPEPKKPAVRRESKTDPKPLLNITNKSMAMERSINTTRTPGKGKFDLKASLAKGLSYEPHKGKVKPLERKREKRKPVLEAASQQETKARQMEVIRGVRLNKRAELMMIKRKMSS